MFISRSIRIRQSAFRIRKCLKEDSPHRLLRCAKHSGRGWAPAAPKEVAALDRRSSLDQVAAPFESSLGPHSYLPTAATVFNTPNDITQSSFHAPRRIRTSDTLLRRQVLFRLSYWGGRCSFDQHRDRGGRIRRPACFALPRAMRSMTGTRSCPRSCFRKKARGSGRSKTGGVGQPLLSTLSSLLPVATPCTESVLPSNPPAEPSNIGAGGFAASALR